MNKLRVLILKPSKYDQSGRVERFRRGFMPNATIPYLKSMTPAALEGHTIETHVIDEYVQTDLSYLRLLKRDGKPHYVQNIPRTWGYLARNLRATALGDLAAWYERHFPVDLRTGRLPV